MDFTKKTLSRVPVCSLPIRSMPKPEHSLVLGGHSADHADPWPPADGHLYPWLLTGPSRDCPIAPSSGAVRRFPSKGYDSALPLGGVLDLCPLRTCSRRSEPRQTWPEWLDST